MPLDYSARVRSAIIVIACFGLASSAVVQHREQAKYRNARVGGDRVTAMGERLQAVRPDLPPYGVIGYITDPPPPGDQHAWAEQAQEFGIAEYHLSPLLMLNRPTLPLVLGNFHQPVSSERIAKLHLVEVKNYGNGLILFRTTPP